MKKDTKGRLIHATPVNLEEQRNEIEKITSTKTWETNRTTSIPSGIGRSRERRETDERNEMGVEGGDFAKIPGATEVVRPTLPTKR